MKTTNYWEWKNQDAFCMDTTWAKRCVKALEEHPIFWKRLKEARAGVPKWENPKRRHPDEWLGHIKAGPSGSYPLDIWALQRRTVSTGNKQTGGGGIYRPYLAVKGYERSQWWIQDQMDPAYILRVSIDKDFDGRRLTGDWLFMHKWLEENDCVDKIDSGYRGEV